MPVRVRATEDALVLTVAILVRAWFGNRERQRLLNSKTLRVRARGSLSRVARITTTSVEAVKAAADIVEVISARTQLRKSGARFQGRCPFHEDRTPSFSVSPDRGLYHCFGCGAGGDLIRFVQETENLDFTGAVEWLAERYRITLEYEDVSPQADERRRRRERTYAVLEHAAAFFERYLWESPRGEQARAYLAERGLGEAVAREFRLGLSPGSGLAAKAQEKGFSVAELRLAGLLSARGNDYFPQRLMFPLADARGRVVGFQARKLRDDDPLQGKYVNSPESDLFHKGAILYGLHLARAAIAKQDRAVVVEGNTDVIALRQVGFEPVVASMGTALTENQVRELARIARRLFLCFDADAAGEAAALRGMALAAEQGFDVKVVTLPPGTDPADAPDGFEERLAGAESHLLHRVRLEIQRASDRQEAFVRVRETLSGFEDSPERQEAVRLASDRLGLPPDTQAGLAPARGRTAAATGTVSRKLLEAGERLERDALAACVAEPGLVGLLSELAPEHFDQPLHRRLRAHLVDPGEANGELLDLLAELDARAAAGGLDEAAGKSALLRLRERALRRELAAATDGERVVQLSTTLARIRETLAQLG
jgi:DNA primase